MIRIRQLRARVGACAAALTLAAAAAACAQEPAPAGNRPAGQGAAAANADSLLPRAQAARSKGNENAPVTIVEVSDFQCPFCARWVQESYAKLDSAYIKTGKARMIFVNYPIPNHQEAYAASEAAMCAGAQGRFWPMHDRLFASQREWNGQADAVTRFEGYAQALGLNMAAYRDCTNNDRVASLIVSDVMGASGAGVNGTPTFILNGRQVLSGAVPFDQMAREIDALLANPNPAPRPGQPGAPQQGQPPAPGPRQ